MPPRAAKKAPGAKKTPARAAKEAQSKSQIQKQIAEEVKVEKPIDEVKPIEKVSEPEPQPEEKTEANGSAPLREEDDVKETFDEEDKGERLELDDNDVEYEPEEDAGLYYNDKEVEPEDAPEEGDGVEEDPEEDPEDRDDGEEEETNMIEEEMEDAAEELEGEEEQENDEEEHHEMADGENKEHHDMVKERRKRKEFEVFVGGLDKDATEDDLKKVFSAVGEVTEVRLMMNPITKKNKGFAFLRFATVEQAKRAVNELSNPLVNGKQCGVTPSQDSDTLFVGNICRSWTTETLKEKLKHYGVVNVEDMTLAEDSGKEGMNRGFAFLEFSSRSDAMDAFKRLQKRDVVFGLDRNAKVAFADSFNEPDDAVMAQVKVVFVDGLPPSWDEDRVKEHLQKFGEIEKIELARNMPSAKRKDFGFVTFATHDVAVSCAGALNNAELGEGDNKVKVRARLSRPLERSARAKHAPRGDFRLGRGAPRVRGSWGRPPAPRTFPSHGSRNTGGRLAPLRGRGFKAPLGYRDRRPVMALPERVRPLPPPARPYNRKPVPSYPKSSVKRDFGRRDELPPRNRAPVDYGTRAPMERRSSYRDDYASRGTGYADDGPRSAPRSTTRRNYVDESYDRSRFERPPPSYREGRAREYDSVSGSKRQYSALEDVPPRYTETAARSRARLDYGVGSSAPQYPDTYSDRIGRSQTGYGAGRSTLSAQESHGMYGGRQGMGYSGGSYGSSDSGGMYSSSYSSDYMSRGSDVADGSYSSLYPSRSLGGSSYMGSGGSGSSSYY
ncbi:hypothetical protein GIB67_012294 [Kingdonia uniflora]|uniref:RRM domain-containing protein n=1 Tax=Kingdonia uniflora TaxID=39325 RepID=A0A7J7MVN4_9MAGN|nr:hypothetical protein GIB67_012294 [Kingdonia uniflora]